jgi:hypothetical protein
VRTEPGGREVERSIPHEQHIRDADGPSPRGHGRVRAFVAEHRQAIEAELVEQALAVHDDVIGRVVELRRAAARHERPAALSPTWPT